MRIILGWIKQQKESLADFDAAFGISPQNPETAYLFRPIAAKQLSTGLHNILLQYGLQNLNDLRALEPAQYLAMRGLGHAKLAELQHFIRQNNGWLYPDHDPANPGLVLSRLQRQKEQEELARSPHDASETLSRDQQALQRISVERLFDPRMNGFFGVTPANQAQHTRMRNAVWGNLRSEKDTSLYDLSRFSLQELGKLDIRPRLLSAFCDTIHKAGGHFKDEKIQPQPGTATRFYDDFSAIVDIDAPPHHIPTLADFRRERLIEWSQGKEDLLTREIGELVPDLSSEAAGLLNDAKRGLVGEIALDGVPEALGLEKAERKKILDRMAETGLAVGMIAKAQQEYETRYPSEKGSKISRVTRIKTLFDLHPPKPGDF